MSTIVLVKVNRPETMAASPPLGLLYLSSALKQAGHHVVCRHVCSHHLEQAARDILALAPLWVGFSVFSGDCLAQNLHLARLLKADGVPVIWGNAHATLCPEQCLADGVVDACVLSEGEETVRDLTAALERGTPLDQVAGLALRAADGTVRRTARRPFMGTLDGTPPDLDALDLSPYLQDHGPGNRRCMPLVASRGCPHDCGICYNGQFNHRRWRHHSPALMRSLIERLADRYRLDSIRFVDDYLLASPRWARTVLDAVPLPFRLAAYPCDITADFMAWIGQSRCSGLFLEIEAATDRILALTGKPYDTGQIEMAVRRLSTLSRRAPSIELHASVLFAYPGEEEHDFRQGLGFVARLMELAPDIRFTCGWFRPYPGTPLWRPCLDRGFVPPQTLEQWDMLDRWKPSLTHLPWAPWAERTAIERLDRVMGYAGQRTARGQHRLRTRLIGHLRPDDMAAPPDHS